LIIGLDPKEIIIDIINIIVLFLFLKKFLFKPVTEMMDKRASLITSNIQDSEDKKTEAYQLKADFEEELKHAGEQASVIIKEARERAELEYNRKLQEARDEAGRVRDEAEKIIELDRKKSMDSAQAEIAGLALLAAAKVIGKNVDDDTNKQYLGDLLKEVGAAK
jgi:F-type H+-transporting ATPase subunit b